MCKGNSKYDCTTCQTGLRLDQDICTDTPDEVIEMRILEGQRYEPFQYLISIIKSDMYQLDTDIRLIDNFKITLKDDPARHSVEELQRL